jgi:hypothetical protein
VLHAVRTGKISVTKIAPSPPPEPPPPIIFFIPPFLHVITKFVTQFFSYRIMLNVFVDDEPVVTRKEIGIVFHEDV